MRSLFFLLASVVFLLSCGNTDQDIQSLMDSENGKEVSQTTSGDSIEVQLQKHDTVMLQASMDFKQKANLFPALFLSSYDSVTSEKSILPDRFSSAFSRKIALKKKTSISYGKVEGVIPVAQLYFYRYADSASLANAKTNWFNCFGNDCTPIKEKENTKAIKTTPSYTIISDSSIVHLSYPCEHAENDWTYITKEMDRLFYKKGSLRIIVGCGGPLEWK